MKNLMNSCLRFTCRQTAYLPAIMLMLMILSVSVKSQYNTATIDAAIGSGEYGVHTDGYNQQTTAGGTWYMAWDTANLYIAYVGPQLTSGKTGVVYLNKDAASLNDYGPTYGSFLGQTFNNTQILFTGQRADAVVYFGSRNKVLISRADGSGGWTASQNVLSQVSFAEDTASSLYSVYEIAIPWYLLEYSSPPSGTVYNPTNLGHLEYVVTSAGSVSAQVPTTNAGGSVGLYASWENNYYVINTNNASYYPYGNVVGWYVCYYDGTVTSAATGLPIPYTDIGFVASGEFYPAQANASGYYYKIVPLNIGIPSYFIFASHAGYTTGSTSTNSCNVTINFQLQP